MNQEKIDMLATIVREHREAKGYTQKEVAEISNVSLRSIQRIENGEVNPRMYTVKVLSECLGFTLDFLKTPIPETTSNVHSKKLILAIGSPILIFLLALAYLLQSATFPETTFELTVYWAAVALLICLIQYRLWVANR